MTYAIITDRDLFLSDSPDESLGFVMGRGYRYTFVKASSGKVKTWERKWEAEWEAGRTSGKVVTAPVCSGGFWTWGEA